MSLEFLSEQISNLLSFGYIYWVEVRLQGISLLYYTSSYPSFPPTRGNLQYVQILYVMAKFMLTKAVLVHACRNGLVIFTVSASFWETLIFPLSNDPNHYSRYLPSLSSTSSLDRHPLRHIHPSQRPNDSKLRPSQLRHRSCDSPLPLRRRPAKAISLQPNVRLLDLRSRACEIRLLLYLFAVHTPGDELKCGNSREWIGTGLCCVGLWSEGDVGL